MLKTKLIVKNLHKNASCQAIYNYKHQNTTIIIHKEITTETTTHKTNVITKP